MIYRLKKDFVIPKGTEFRNVDSTQTTWISGNYEAIISITDDKAASFIINDEFQGDLPEDYFEALDFVKI